VITVKHACVFLPLIFLRLLLACASDCNAVIAMRKNHASRHRCEFARPEKPLF